MTKHICDKCGKEMKSTESYVYFRYTFKKKQSRDITLIDYCESCVKGLLGAIQAFDKDFFRRGRR